MLMSRCLVIRGPCIYPNVGMLSRMYVGMYVTRQ